MSKKQGLLVTSYCLQDLRESSVRKYEMAWMALVSYVRLKKLCSFLENVFLQFFTWLFEENGLHANAIAFHKWALVKPILIGFGITLNADVL